MKSKIKSLKQAKWKYNFSVQNNGYECRLFPLLNLYATIEQPHYVISIQNGGARKILKRKHAIFISIFLH